MKLPVPQQILMDQQPITPAMRQWMGGVSKSLHEEPWVNVKEFGAKGDDSTDDHRAITAAIASIGDGPGCIFFPAGIYRVSAALSISYSMTLLGLGPFQSIIRTTSATAHIIAIDPGANIVSGIDIRDLGLATSVTRTAGAAVSALTASTGSLFALRLSNINAYGNMAHGIHVDAALQSVYFDNVVIESVGDTCFGFYFRGEGTSGYCGNIWMYRCRVQTGRTSSTYGLVFDSYSQGAYVTDCAFEGALGVGVFITNGLSATRPVENLFFSGVVCDYCSNIGCVIDNVYSAHFTNCWFTSSTNSGFKVVAGTDVSLGNCYVISNGTSGVWLAGGSEARIQNSIIDGNSQSSSGNHDGIVVSANVGDFIIVGNHFNRTGTTASQRYSINTVAGTGDNYIIAHNNVRGYVTGGVNDAAAGANIVVANNLA